MFSHYRVWWWSILNMVVNCCSIREGIAICVTVGLLRLTVVCVVIWNQSPQLQCSAQIEWKGKTRIQVKEYYSSQFSWYLSPCTLHTALVGKVESLFGSSWSGGLVMYMIQNIYTIWEYTLSPVATLLLIFLFPAMNYCVQLFNSLTCSIV